MRKKDEQELEGSCFNRALPHEMVFVLLGRDAAAPDAIRAWAAKRVELGLNDVYDKQIEPAMNTATTMEKERPSILTEILESKGEHPSRSELIIALQIARDALVPTLGAFDALKVIEADKHLSGFKHTLKNVTQAISVVESTLASVVKR